MHGMDQSLELTLPPLATIYLQLTGSVKKSSDQTAAPPDSESR